MPSDNANTLEELWGEGAVRAFIAHTSKWKTQAAEIRDYLRHHGVASFVAHEDIEPMKDWQSELLRALFSMDVLVALLTDDFSDSKWTDQEVGIAIGRGTPVIPIRLGCDPYGYIGKFQALRGSFEKSLVTNGTATIAKQVFETIVKEESAGVSAKDAYVLAVSNAVSFAQANYLAGLLPSIDALTPEQVRSLVDAFNKNGQVRSSYGFDRNLINELIRITGYDFDWFTDANGQRQLRSVDLWLDLAFGPLPQASA